MFSRCFRLFVLSLIAASVASCSNFSPNQEHLRSREAMLKDNLIQMRQMTRQYAIDKGDLPQSLDDLVRARYLQQIPVDPMTEKKDWKVVVGEDTDLSKGKRGIIEIRSSSTAKSLEGTPYNQW